MDLLLHWFVIQIGTNSIFNKRISLEFLTELDFSLFQLKKKIRKKIREIIAFSEQTDFENDEQKSPTKAVII